MTEQPAVDHVVKVGDIWKELDPRPEYQRYVRVLRVSGDSALIWKVEQRPVDWHPVKGSVARWAQLKRFHGKRGGYALHQRDFGGGK